MTIAQGTSFTSGERTALKNLISSHADWSQYRSVVINGRATHEMTVPELIDCANQFGIDHLVCSLAASPSSQNAIASTPAPVAPAPASAPAYGPHLPHLPDTAPDADTSAPDSEAAPAAPAQDMESILSGVAPFMHPDMMKELESKLVPIFEAASAQSVAPVIVYRGKQMDSNPDGSTPAIRSGQERLGALFGIRGKNADFKCTIWSSASAPAPDPHYQFNIQTMHIIMQCLEDGGDIWLTGHSGTGKTTLVKEIASRTGRGFFRFSMNRQTELSEYMGQRLPDENMKLPFVAGAFVKAWTTQGALILIDEITMLQAGNAAMFATALDEGVITIPETGEDIYKADGVTIIACDNTNGTGDQTGLYGGTNEASLALRDRFEACLEMHYLPVAKEAKLLQDKTGLAAGAATALCQFAAVQRKGVRNDDMDAPITLRRLSAWAKRIVGGIESKLAFEVSVLNSASPDDALALTGLAELHAKHSDIDTLAAGQTVTTESGSQTSPEGKSSASDFAGAETVTS